MFSSNASQVSSDAVFIEDVMSTFLYAGNGSTQTITNGIDLAGEGGLVWIKGRNIATNNLLFDTNRGVNNYLVSDTTGAQANPGNTLSAFNANGFTVKDLSNFINETGFNYASWTFRKQPKFFDVVTYTGTGSNRTVAHALGSVPGCIIVKRTDTTADWAVYHRSLANTQYLVLNTTAAAATGATWWNSTTPTSAVFSLGTDASVNASGGTYVAYIYAHDAGGFGLSGNENVVSCGTYTGNGSATGPVVTLGYEPQWLMIKRSSGAGNWVMLDVMRGFSDSSDNELYADLALEEGAGLNLATPVATGFQLQSSTGNVNGAGSTYIYIAIRRGPMAVPTLGTTVFKAISTPAGTTVTAGFAPDFVIAKQTDNGVGNSSATYVGSRLQGNGAYLSMSDTSAEGAFGWQWNDPTNKFTQTSSGAPTYSELFARAPSFMDVVCYTGTGVARTVAHNLAAVPELIIVKCRSASAFWPVYSSGTGPDYYSVLNTTAAKAQDTALWNNTSPTASVFSLGNSWVQANESGATYVAYLFATCAGVSKVGSYTGTGTTQAINCGFTAGARFVLIKRTDSTGDWYVWDSARGIVANSDPYLLLNSTAAEVTGTDYIDPSSAGFEISSTAPDAINASGGSFVFLAVA